jgi:hypothetical protein
MRYLQNGVGGKVEGCRAYSRRTGREEQTLAFDLISTLLWG